MAYEDLHPQSKEYIDALVANIEAGTHTAKIIRYSGSSDDPRSKIVQKSAGAAPDHVIFLEGFASGDSFQRLVGRGMIKGSWATPDTWEGAVEDSTLEAYRAG